MDAIGKLHSLGQSLWYDNIQRRLLESGEFEEMILHGEIRGVTSNPSIFHNAIAKSSDYDSALATMAWSGWDASQIFDQLALEDIRAAADLFLPLYQETEGRDGFVSLEVDPQLAKSTAATVNEAKRLWQAADRPNVMIKIPATQEGIPAIEQAIAYGININITLIFSLKRYGDVMEAYLVGLEQRVENGLPIDRIASVASFFVSRVDSKVDARLQEIVQKEGPQAEKAASLLGKAAVANAKIAYAQFKDIFSGPRFQRLQEKGARLQRPLWASTSTKNPDYPDVKYVEELIGADTVNTIPPQTLDAYRDHGNPAITITEGLVDARATLSGLEDLGISLAEVTHDLELEGVKAFSDAYTALLQAIDERRAEAQKQLGPLRDLIPERVKTLDQGSIIERMFNEDPSIWTDDPSGQTEVRNRLGWLDLPTSSLLLMDEISEFTENCVKDGLTHALLLGMGGSSLAPEVLQLMFEDSSRVKIRPGLDLQILDSTDPDQILAAEERTHPEHTLYIVSSKSGTTSEVNSLLAYFWNEAEKKLDKEVGKHFVAITDPSTPLERVAVERKFRAVFLADLMVGGRYSALTAFGLVPAGLMGLDLARLLASAEWMQKQCSPEVPTGRNLGAALGAIIGEGALQGRDKLTFLIDPEWSSFGAWLEQLIAESSGKQGKGIIPVDGEPLDDPDQYGKDRLFVYLKGSGRLANTVERLIASGQPVPTIQFREPYEIGSEFYRWEIATAVACSILGVNAFDQPDVQDNKQRTSNRVKTYQDAGTLDEGEPIWRNAEGQVYGKPFPGVEKAQSLKDVVKVFVGQGKPGDYIALNAYLPRTPSMQVKLNKLRSKIGELTSLATTLGYGPRFLHSTGQLHKGGPDSGIFLQITRDPEKDVVIPGEEMTFGTLERAQALGDLEALLSRDRQAIRIHLLEGEVENLL